MKSFNFNVNFNKMEKVRVRERGASYEYVWGRVYTQVGEEETESKKAFLGLEVSRSLLLKSRDFAGGVREYDFIH
jgi:hypothetical protein